MNGVRPTQEQLNLDFKTLSEKVQKASESIRDAYSRGKAPPQKTWDAFKDCEDFAWRSAKELGRGNVLVYRATELVVNTARDFSVAKDSFAKQNIQTDGDSSEELRRRWGEATIRRVAQQECAAAGCSKGGDCFGTESEHPAVYEAAEVVCGYDLGVARCRGAITPSPRLVSRRGGRGWFPF